VTPFQNGHADAHASQGITFAQAPDQCPSLGKRRHSPTRRQRALAGTPRADGSYSPLRWFSRCFAVSITDCDQLRPAQRASSRRSVVFRAKRW
jgi:hypothetical protein